MSSNMCQDECKSVDHGVRHFGSSMMQKDVNFYAAEAAVSKRFSIHDLLDSPSDSRKFVSSNYLSSEWSQCPIFQINQKIDSIFNPKQSGISSDKLFVPQQSLKVNMSTPNIMAFSSQEYQFHSHQMTDESMNQCKPAEGILFHLENHIGLNCDPGRQKLKGQLSIAASCSCSKDENNSSGSLVDEHHTPHCFANSKQESPHLSSENKFRFSANRSENKSVESIFWDEKSRTSGGHQKQQDIAGVVFCEKVPGRDYGDEPFNDSNIGKQDVDDSHGTYSSHDVVFARSSSQDEQQHLNTHRMDSAVIVTESYQNMLTVKSKGEVLSHRKHPDPIKRKGPYLFEMLTLPSESHGAYSRDAQSREKSNGKGVCIHGTNNHLLGAQNQSSAKSDTMYSDTYHATKSSAGFASQSADKDSSPPNSAETGRLATSIIVSSCSKENGLLNKYAEQDDFSSGKQERSMPKTANMDVDVILFQLSRMKNPISNMQVQSPVYLEPSERWLKRLRHDISDPYLPVSKKRSKVGDGPQAGETSSLFDRSLSYNRSNADMIEHVKKDQLSGERIKVQCYREVSHVPANSLNDWIRRWCQGGTPTVHGASDQGRGATKSNLAPEEVEGQFPSLAAMAMMGRVMRKLQPCELHRKGPSVVWKTEGY